MLFKSNFLPKILIFIFSTLLIYTYYRSEILYDGSLREKYLIITITLIILLFFSIFLLFVNDKIREILLIFFSTFILSLYSFEIFLIFDLKNLKKRIEFKKETTSTFDKRSRFEIFRDMRVNNKEVVLTFYSEYLNLQNDKIYSLSGIPNSKTIHCNENGYFSIYKSDRYGFNNPDKEWDKKEIEFVVVGDSYVHGACVNRPHDIGSVLRKLSGKAVLNLGYDKSNPVQYYARLKEFMPKNVKNVLWFFYEGNDLVKSKNYFIVEDYLNDENFSQDILSKFDEINEKKKEFLENSFKNYNSPNKFLEFIKLYNLRYFISWYFAQDYDVYYDDFEKSLKRSINLSKNNNSNFYFIYIHNRQGVDLIKKNKKNLKFEKVNKILSDLDVKIIYAFPDINDYYTKSFYPRFGGHFSVEGYKKISENIFEELQK